MEERLRSILARIEASSLTQDEKIQLCGMISEGLKASIWPSILQDIPDDKKEILFGNGGKPSVDEYQSTLLAVLEKKHVQEDIDQTMNKLLDAVDAALKEDNI